ncbi:MAG: VOC family protein [Planctomycetota bacterium]
MKYPSVVVRTVDVEAEPAAAFEMFTREMGVWYRSTPYSWNDADRAVGIRLEPGVGGRLVEVHDRSSGEEYEFGKILVWEPGVRLVFSFRSVFLPPDPLTEVEVRFEAVGAGTRVTLEHRGLDRLPADVEDRSQGRGWILFLDGFRKHVSARRGERPPSARKVPSQGAAMAVKPIPDGFHTVTPYLVVPGAPRLIEFLKRVFDAEEVERTTRPDGTIGCAAVRIGDSMLMMGEAQGAHGSKPATLYVYVKDTDAAYRKAIQAGATSVCEPMDMFYGDRSGGVKDPCGNEWFIATHREDLTREEIERRGAAHWKK